MALRNIDSDIGLSLMRHQAIALTSVDMLCKIFLSIYSEFNNSHDAATTHNRRLNNADV